MLSLALSLCVLIADPAELGGVRMGWNGQIDVWGTMREVLAEGQTKGRIALAELINKSDLIGVGAIENLEGEITIWNGHVWVTKGTPAAVEGSTESAALLITARVNEWSSVVHQTAISMEQLEHELRKSGNRWTQVKRFPFVIEGNLTVNAHIVRGKCPHGEEVAGGAPPIPFSLNDEPAIVVGFFAEDGEGVVTHHRSKIHAHVITKEIPPRTGHVDRLSLAPGATIRVPARH